MYIYIYLISEVFYEFGIVFMIIKFFVQYVHSRGDGLKLTLKYCKLKLPSVIDYLT